MSKILYPNITTEWMPHSVHKYHNIYCKHPSFPKRINRIVLFLNGYLGWPCAACLWRRRASTRCRAVGRTRRRPPRPRSRRLWTWMLGINLLSKCEISSKMGTKHRDQPKGFRPKHKELNFRRAISAKRGLFDLSNLWPQ